jgi:hypothetical protein
MILNTGEEWRDELVGLTSQIQNKTGNTIRGVGRA